MHTLSRTCVMSVQEGAGDGVVLVQTALGSSTSLLTGHLRFVVGNSRLCDGARGLGSPPVYTWVRSLKAEPTELAGELGVVGRAARG